MLNQAGKTFHGKFIRLPELIVMSRKCLCNDGCKLDQRVYWDVGYCSNENLQERILGLVETKTKCLMESSWKVTKCLAWKQTVEVMKNYNFKRHYKPLYKMQYKEYSEK